MLYSRSLALEQVACFGQASEELTVQQFVAQTRVEGLDLCVLPGSAGPDEERRHPDAPEPSADRLRDNIRAVVRADVVSYATLAPDRREDANHIFGRDQSHRVHAQQLARILVDYRQDLHLPTVFGPLDGEVVRPDVILGHGVSADVGVAGIAVSSSLAVFAPHAHPLMAPQALHAHVFHAPAAPEQHLVDAQVALARMLRSKLAHVGE